jgi:hypothetical protein
VQQEIAARLYQAFLPRLRPLARAVFFMSVQLDIAISIKTNGTFSHPNGAGHVQRAVGAVPTAQDVPSSPLKRHIVMGQDVTPIRTSLIRTSHRLCLSHLPWLGVCGGGIC